MKNICGIISVNRVNQLKQLFLHFLVVVCMQMWAYFKQTQAVRTNIRTKNSSTTTKRTTTKNKEKQERTRQRHVWNDRDKSTKRWQLRFYCSFCVLMFIGNSAYHKQRQITLQSECDQSKHLINLSFLYERAKQFRYWFEW